MSSINNNTMTKSKKKMKDIPSEFKKLAKMKKNSQIDKHSNQKDRMDEVVKKPKKPKIYSVIDLVMEQKK